MSLNIYLLMSNQDRNTYLLVEMTLFKRVNFVPGFEIKLVQKATERSIKENLKLSQLSQQLTITICLVFKLTVFSLITGLFFFQLVLLFHG